MRVGDVCFVGEVSSKSLEIWRLKSQIHKFLIRPCSIPKSQSLQIASFLTPKLVMVNYYNNPSKVAILYVDDLIKAESDD